MPGEAVAKNATLAVVGNSGASWYHRHTRSGHRHGDAHRKRCPRREADSEVADQQIARCAAHLAEAAIDALEKVDGQFARLVNKNASQPPILWFHLL